MRKQLYQLDTMKVAALSFEAADLVRRMVLPVEPDLLALEKRLSQRLFQRSPASLNATDRSLLHAAVYEDIVEMLGIGGSE